jgi:hypothetical protein
MASNNKRAILADITDHSLNPKERHVSLKNGRLQAATKPLHIEAKNKALKTSKEIKKSVELKPAIEAIAQVVENVEILKEVVETSVKLDQVIQEQPEIFKFDAATENAKLEKKNKGKFKKSLV